MTISDETLMAYADGELGAAEKAVVESAMREDPQIEKRLAQHRALRQRVHAAYSAELSEAVPERLLTAARGDARDPGGKVVSLEEARAAMQRNARARPPRPQWRMARTIAASVIVGLGLGFLMWGRSESPLVRSAGGALVAQGQLARALSDQLAAEQTRTSAVHIGLSFLGKSGEYCRTFVLSGAVSPSGLACRHGEEWQVLALNQGPDRAAGDSEYRAAGSAMSVSILKIAEEQIAGEPLDQAGERAARQRDWKLAGR